MLNLTNWYARLNAFFCLSIISGNNSGFLSYGPYGPYGQNPQPTAAQIAAEIAKINPTLISSAPTPITYTPNQYTQGQLAQFNQPQGMQSSPYYQQYLNKMSGMGAGAGKNMPSIAPTQGSK